MGSKDDEPSTFVSKHYVLRSRAQKEINRVQKLKISPQILIFRCRICLLSKGNTPSNYLLQMKLRDNVSLVFSARAQYELIQLPLAPFRIILCAVRIRAQRNCSMPFTKHPSKTSIFTAESFKIVLICGRSSRSS